MNLTDANPPTINLDPLIEELSEGPWTALVMSLLACVGVVLLAAGVYAGGM